jgi:hypothetical protein
MWKTVYYSTNFSEIDVISLLEYQSPKINIEAKENSHCIRSLVAVGTSIFPTSSSSFTKKACRDK